VPGEALIDFCPGSAIGNVTHVAENWALSSWNPADYLAQEIESSVG
jgi:hypothetical protein